MFDIGWTELVVIAVVAIVVIGPKDLPRAMRTVGQFTGKLRRMAREFQGQFNEAIREAELEDVKKSIQDLAKVDPIADIKAETAKVDQSIRAELNKPEPDPVMKPLPPSEPAAAAAPVEAPAIASEAKP
ncbi:MAG: twin-arginine translocase subunit TatB [Rhizobiales bacterium]|jgi:sec-independent protein translocase protein TatB|nr:twin-arginine translocase subunit TatB [Hyphomicrobiales bacterium]